MQSERSKEQETAHLRVKDRLISKISKGTVHSKTGHEVPEEEQRYSSR